MGTNIDKYGSNIPLNESRDYQIDFIKGPREFNKQMQHYVFCP